MSALFEYFSRPDIGTILLCEFPLLFHFTSVRFCLYNDEMITENSMPKNIF